MSNPGIASEIMESAVAALPIPFLSNELRKTVGRVLKLPVPDAQAYDRADRPVPVTMKKKSVSVEPTAPQLRSENLAKTAVIPPQLPVESNQALPADTAADLPQVSVHSRTEIPEYDVIAPTPTEKQEMPAIDHQTIQTISAEYIEKVVWEVVPRLAERILREEIAKLLRDKIDE